MSQTMPVERKCEVYVLYLDGYFAGRVFGISAAESFCRRHRGERPSYELEGIYDEDFKKDWEAYR